MLASLFRSLPQALVSVAVLVVGASSAAAADQELTTGFSGALKGCEQWVLNPKSWIDGPATFIAAIGLGERVTQLSKVGDFALPPPALRQANHYWRIDAIQTAGFVLVTSDRLPMCHITGAGQGAFRSSVASVLASPDFLSRWERTGELTSASLTSTTFRSRAEPAFEMTVTRPTPGGESGGVQVIATALFKIGE